MMQVIVSSYDAAFSSGARAASRASSTTLRSGPLRGRLRPDTAGGFAVWRGGTFVLVVGALWAVFATVRVLRGEEDQGRWDLLLAEPISGVRALGIHLAVLGAAVCSSDSASPACSSAPTNRRAAPSSTALGSLSSAAIGVGLGALSAQLFGQRRKAAGAAGGVIGAFYVVRMLADASSGLGWLRSLTPFGWVEQLRAFAGNDVLPLVPLVVRRSSCRAAGGPTPA